MWFWSELLMCSQYTYGKKTLKQQSSHGCALTKDKKRAIYPRTSSVLEECEECDLGQVCPEEEIEDDEAA
jgi:hypothetical protein